MEWKRLGLQPITRVSGSGLRGREGSRHSPKHSESGLRVYKSHLGAGRIKEGITLQFPRDPLT